MVFIKTPSNDHYNGIILDFIGKYQTLELNKNYIYNDFIIIIMKLLISII